MRKIFYILMNICFASILMCCSNPNKYFSLPLQRPEPGEFSIFLCFGQSNMEGCSIAEQCDYENIPDNFLTMITANCDVKHYGQERYTWRKATPPLARYYAGLSPASQFGKKLIQKFPDNSSIGIVMVAIGATPIEVFDKDKYKEYCNREDIEDCVKEWLLEYDNNPYEVLISAAKEAQKKGVIRGILLHQGENNCLDSTWPKSVKKIYNNIINDLNLNPRETPLLAGELLRTEYGGICGEHNRIIAKLPDVLPNSYIISSYGLTGKDVFHFSSSGYRLLGERYANTLLELYGLY